MDDARIFIVRTTNSCNLACSYCYVHDKGAVKIDLEIVKRLIAQSAALDEGTIVFIWHGGEPLLMGLRFFEAIVDLQNQFPKQFINAVQTNGLSLNERYVNFFKTNSFKVAVSLDIPRDRHNQNRRLKNGKTGSFDLIAKNLELLAKYEMPIAVLGVVTKLDLDVHSYVKFIETYHLDSLALNLEFALGRTTNKKSAARYSYFLKELYRYSERADRNFHLREADTIIENVRRMPSSICLHSPKFCGYTHSAVAENGDIYICCDKFINSPWAYAKLGNIGTDNISDIFASDQFHDLMHVLAAKRSDCVADCAIGKFCKGACIHDALASQDLGGRRREQIGCVARGALLSCIENDFTAAK